MSIYILFMKRRLPKQFSNLQAAIALSTHAQNVKNKKKCAVGAKKLNTKAETIVSGAKNMVNRPTK